MITSIDWEEISKTGVVPDGMGLLTEEKSFEILNRRTIKEEKTGRNVMRLTGIIQRCNKRNENGRIYDLGVIREAVESIQPSIMHRKVMGEFDHPTDAKIHMDRVSHLMTKVWMESDKVMGELEVIEAMPCGQMLKALVDAGVTIGISSRGVGDMEPVMSEGAEEVLRVLPGYRFVTWDVVAEPSVKEAELKLMESKNRNIKSNRNIEQAILNEIKGLFQ